MDINELKKNARQERIERWIKLAPVLLAILTTIFLLNGRAYSEGYTHHFRLNSTMFDDDLGDMVMISATAWAELLALALGVIEKFLHHHWVALAVTVVFILGFPRVVRWCAVWSRRRRRGIKCPLPMKMKPATAMRIRHAIRRVKYWLASPPWARLFPKWIWLVSLGSYLGITGITMVALILLSLVVPFQYVGNRVAAEHQAMKFADNPTVTMTDPEGHRASYQIMLCQTRFCALYTDSTVITVPAAAVTWGVSPLNRDSKAIPSPNQPAQQLQSPPAKGPA